MEYRKLPHGEENEVFSTLGLGMGGIQKCSEDEIEKVIRKAIGHVIQSARMKEIAEYFKTYNH